MELKITGRHTSVTEAMKRHAVEKLSRLDRHNDMLQNAEIVMSVEGDRQIIEMIAHSRAGGALVGKAEHTDMYAAVDLLVDKMERQVRRQKEKVKVKTHSGRSNVKTMSLEAAEASMAVDEDVEESAQGKVGG